MSRSIEVDAPPVRVVLDAAEVYDAHADFVWRSLHRLGIRSADLPDVLQEVFLVVHRRRSEWDGRPICGWLWGICVGLARNYRRRKFRRAEVHSAVPEQAGPDNPERALEAQRDREHGERLLAALDPEKRAVFVMFEVEAMSGARIAELLDVPVATVHTRLYAARRELARALEEDR